MAGMRPTSAAGAADSWRRPFPDGRAPSPGGSTVPSGTNAAAASFLIVTDTSRLVALPATQPPRRRRSALLGGPATACRWHAVRPHKFGTGPAARPARRPASPASSAASRLAYKALLSATPDHPSRPAGRAPSPRHSRAWGPCLGPLPPRPAGQASGADLRIAAGLVVHIGQPGLAQSLNGGLCHHRGLLEAVNLVAALAAADARPGHGAWFPAWRVSSRRTEIRQSPRSRTLVSSPCSAGWSATRPQMTVSSPWPLICRPSNQTAHRPSRTPATRISYQAGQPEALTTAPASARPVRRNVLCLAVPTAPAAKIRGFVAVHGRA